MISLVASLALVLAAPPDDKSKSTGGKPPDEGVGFIELTTPQGQTVKVSNTHDVWADRVVSYTPGKPRPNRDTDPKDAVGRPNFRAKFPRNSVSLGRSGELVLEFVDNVLVDGPGDDLVIFEVGPKVEATRVAISTDGKDWLEIATVRGAKSTLDIGPRVKPGQQFRFVRLTDIQKPNPKEKQVPGADIDAVGALNSRPAAAPPPSKP
jgi:hypothetical protein